MHGAERHLQTFLDEAKKRVLNFIIQMGDFYYPYAGTVADSKQREKYRKIHEEISIFSFDELVSYHEVFRLFVTSDGILNPDLCSEDGIHLKPEGYKIWV